MENKETSKNGKQQNIKNGKQRNIQKCASKAYLVLFFAQLVHIPNGCGIIMGLNKVQSLGSEI